jgi:hypothetical protein
LAVFRDQCDGHFASNKAVRNPMQPLSMSNAMICGQLELQLVDADLERFIAAWPTLPPAARQALLTMLGG